jgi:AAA15 family ATPase/GTPase
MFPIYENHSNRLPFVRIKHIELTNFKGVQHGVIDFNCAKEFIPYDTKADILGLYGQNGSGKSSLVEAIDLVKGIISGARITPYYTRFIDVLTGFAVICIEFDFQYTNGDVVSVSYEAKLEVKTNKENEHGTETASADNTENEKKYLAISDEIIKTNLYADGSIGRIHTIIDTSKYLLCPDSLAEYYYDKSSKNVLDDLAYLKRRLYEDSQSFVFNHAVSESFNLVNTENASSRYYEILAELNLFATSFLYVTGSRAPGTVAYNYMLRFREL